MLNVECRGGPVDGAKLGLEDCSDGTIVMVKYHIVVNAYAKEPLLNSYIEAVTSDTPTLRQAKYKLRGKRLVYSPA